MAISVREHIIHREKPEPGLQSLTTLVEDCKKDIFMVKHGTPDCIGINLFLYSDDNRVTWRDYRMTDPRCDIHQVESKINNAIQEPNVEYFVIACGGIHQQYDSRRIILDIGNDPNGILSMLVSSSSPQ